MINYIICIRINKRLFEYKQKSMDIFNQLTCERSVSDDINEIISFSPRKKTGIMVYALNGCRIYYL